MSVLILAEHDGHKLKQATYRAATAAQHWQSPVHVLVVGHHIAAIAQEAAAIQGVAQVLQADAAPLARPLADSLMW